MRSLTRARPALGTAYRRSPRPVVLKRLEHIARDVGNERLADMIEGVLAEEQSVRIGRDRTDVGRGLVIPQVVASAGTSHRPWLDRLRVAIRRSRDAAAKVIGEMGGPAPHADLEGLLQRAARAKASDAYHSSSIEGYRLSLDDVAVLLGEGAGGGRDIEDVRSKLAVMGYGIAFDRLLRRIRDASGEVPLTSDLALDLYTDLFAPSLEAGLLPANDLRGWRTGSVFIRDTLYVPPGAAKVPAMLDLMFEELGEIGYGQGMLRGILVHLWFVWVHPVPDGNGRTARLLMNTAFFGAGIPWLTIRVEQRDEYFATLRSAQLDEDFAPFARFILRSAAPG
ncbi:MAG: Fic family protein [Gemmatimonadetes bacterium]|nr:Fic family protein [Gemmatimonadota bacterium]